MDDKMEEISSTKDNENKPSSEKPSPAESKESLNSDASGLDSGEFYKEISDCCIDNVLNTNNGEIFNDISKQLRSSLDIIFSENVRNELAQKFVTAAYRHPTVTESIRSAVDTTFVLNEITPADVKDGRKKYNALVEKHNGTLLENKKLKAENDKLKVAIGLNTKELSEAKKMAKEASLVKTPDVQALKDENTSLKNDIVQHKSIHAKQLQKIKELEAELKKRVDGIGSKEIVDKPTVVEDTMDTDENETIPPEIIENEVPEEETVPKAKVIADISAPKITADVPKPKAVAQPPVPQIREPTPERSASRTESAISESGTDGPRLPPPKLTKPADKSRKERKYFEDNGPEGLYAKRFQKLKNALIPEFQDFAELLLQNEQPIDNVEFCIREFQLHGSDAKKAKSDRTH